MSESNWLISAWNANVSASAIVLLCAAVIIGERSRVLSTREKAEKVFDAK